MLEWIKGHKGKAILLCQLILLMLYTAYAAASYSDYDTGFGENDMQLLTERGEEPGFYLDTTFEGVQAVVTPAFVLDRGIYHISGSYQGEGINRAGLLYDGLDGEAALVEENEFVLNTRDQSFSYRFRLDREAAVRFKLRLTQDAGEGDYVLLSGVHVVRSKLTVVYQVFCLGCLFVLLDAAGLYYAYCKKCGPERRCVMYVLAACSFLIGLPIYQKGTVYAADLTFHLQRIEGIYEGLLAGQFPVRIQPGWLDGNGYAVSIFYSDLFLYFPALLRMVGVTVQDAFGIYMECVNIATVYTAFWAFRKISQSDVAAMTGAVVYAGCIERISSMYGGTLLGTYSAMIFYPVVAAAFYLLFAEDVKSRAYKNTWIYLTVGFSGLLMTHMISCLMVGMFSVLLCIVMAKRLLRRETLAELVKAVTAGVLVNLWFLVPFFQYMAGNYRISSGLTQKIASQDYYAELEDFIRSGKSLAELYLNHEGVDFAGLLVLLAYIGLCLVWKNRRGLTADKVIFGFAVFGMWLSSDLFPVLGVARCAGPVVKLFRTVQYQARFLSVTVLLIALLAVMLIHSDAIAGKWPYLLAGVLCFVTLQQDMDYLKGVTPERVYLDRIDLASREDDTFYAYGVGNGEYLPAGTDTTRITREIRADGFLETEDVERRYLTFEMTVGNRSDQAGTILLPLIYYEGYRAVDTQNGAELETAMGDNGQAAVTVPAGYTGRIRVTFCPPWYWRLSEIVSLAACLAVCWLELRYCGRTAFFRNKIKRNA